MMMEISIGLGLEAWFFVCLWIWQRAKDAMWGASPIVATCLFLSGGTVAISLLVKGAAVLTPLWLGVGALAFLHLVAAQREGQSDQTQANLPTPYDSGQERVSPYLARSQDDSMKGDLILKTRRSMGSFDKDWLWLVASWPCCITIAVKSLGMGTSVGMLVVLLPIGLWIRLVLKAWSTRYYIYQNRIDFETGLISRRNTPLWLWQIKDIEYDCSWLDRLTGGATVVILAEQATREKGPNSVVEYRICGMPSARPDWGSTKFIWEFHQDLLDAALIKRRVMKNWFQ